MKGARRWMHILWSPCLVQGLFIQSYQSLQQSWKYIWTSPFPDEKTRAQRDQDICQYHTAHKWQSQDLTLSLPAFRSLQDGTFAFLHGAAFAKERMLGDSQLPHLHLHPCPVPQTWKVGGHQEISPRACSPAVAELGIAQGSAQVLTGCPEARTGLHPLHSKRKRYSPPKSGSKSTNHWSLIVKCIF